MPPALSLARLGLALATILAVPAASFGWNLPPSLSAAPGRIAAAGGLLLRLRGGAQTVAELVGLRERDHPNATVAQANRILWESAERGQMPGIAKAMSRGAEIGGRGPGGWTALHYAARYGHAEAVSRLIELGARLEARTTAHFTPLHHAAMRGHTDAAIRLVDAGADIFAQTADEYTPMDWAARNGHIECLTALHDLSKAHDGEPKQPPLGAVAMLDGEGQVVRVVRTRPDTTGRGMETPWSRFGKFEWQARGLATPPS